MRKHATTTVAKRTAMSKKKQQGLATSQKRALETWHDELPHHKKRRSVAARPMTPPGEAAADSEAAPAALASEPQLTQAESKEVDALLAGFKDFLKIITHGRGDRDEIAPVTETRSMSSARLLAERIVTTTRWVERSGCLWAFPNGKVSWQDALVLCFTQREHKYSKPEWDYGCVWELAKVCLGRRSLARHMLTTLDRMLDFTQKVVGGISNGDVAAAKDLLKEATRLANKEADAQARSRSRALRFTNVKHMYLQGGADASQSAGALPAHAAAEVQEFMAGIGKEPPLLADRLAMRESAHKRAMKTLTALLAREGSIAEMTTADVNGLVFDVVVSMLEGTLAQRVQTCAELRFGVPPPPRQGCVQKFWIWWDDQRLTLTTYLTLTLPRTLTLTLTLTPSLTPSPSPSPSPRGGYC